MPRNMSVICCCVTCTALQGEPRPCTQICACVLHTWMSVLSLLERSSACARVWRMTSLLCARNRSFRDISFLESCHKTTHPLLRLLSSSCHIGCSCRDCTEINSAVGMITLPPFSISPPLPSPPSPAHENNAHCLPMAVNSIGGSLFSFYGGHHQRERMKEFLVVSIAVWTARPSSTEWSSTHTPHTHHTHTTHTTHTPHTIHTPHTTHTHLH